MKTIHLICNAHLDPVWLWQWEEGAAEAVSTFRVAVEFIEKYDGFIFNHNEAILYEWVSQYEPGLFSKIQELVKAGKWHIMGGWYLQPDCNMPSGEAFVRQILAGQKYFKENFGKRSSVAVNFDSFGHSRGLVQIMKKSGYKQYMFMRPNPVPYGSFKWVGFDGSEIIAHRIYDEYLTRKGEAVKKIKNYMSEFPHENIGMLTWGVGNHGGGASKVDLDDITRLLGEDTGYKIIHSTPESYFESADTSNLPKNYSSLRPQAIGCYTSMVRVKQLYRRLENQLFLAEKMAVHAEIEENELEKAEKSLIFNQFHDILPGSMVKPSEDDTLRSLNYGLEIANKLIAECFFKLCAGQEKANDGELPIMVYNPHPYSIKTLVECEFQLANQNWNDNEHTIALVYNGDKKMKCQNIKENSNIHLDWRKKILFEAELLPSQISRFDCKFKVVKKPLPQYSERISFTENEASFYFKSGNNEVSFNKKTGLIDSYIVAEKSYLKKNALELIVIEDSEDPWCERGVSFSKKIGSFKLLSTKKANEFCGYKDESFEPVRVIEDGEVRFVIQAIFGYKKSYAVVEYKVNKASLEIDLDIRLFWNEVNRMVKLSIPTELKGDFLSQTAFGTETLSKNGNEETFQKWCGINEKDELLAVINNGIYGGSMENNQLRITLLRSSAYSALQLPDRPILPRNRFLPHLDMGERSFNLRISAGKNLINEIDARAEIYNQPPILISFYASGQGEKPKSLIETDNKRVIISAIKKSHDGNGHIIRLYNSSPSAEAVKINSPFFGINETLTLTPFEVKTYRITDALYETDMMEGLF